MQVAKGGSLHTLRTAWKVFCYGLGMLVLAVVAVQCWFFAHVLWWRVYRRRNDIGYATFIVLGKLPHCQGQLRFWLDRLQGRAPRIIEYK